jgi:hypothetical protein
MATSISAVLGRLSSISNGTVIWDNQSVVGDEIDVFICGRDHSVNVAAGHIVDERVNAVPPRIARAVICA